MSNNHHFKKSKSEFRNLNKIDESHPLAHSIASMSMMGDPNANFIKNDSI